MARIQVRKVVQFAAVLGAADDMVEYLRCDDGTIWFLDYGEMSKGWRRLNIDQVIFEDTDAQ